MLHQFDLHPATVLALQKKKPNQKKAKKVFKPGGSSLLSEPPDKNGGRNE